MNTETILCPACGRSSLNPDECGFCFAPRQAQAQPASAATQPAPTLFPPGPWEAHGCSVYEVDKWKDGNNEGGQFVACTVDLDFLEMPTDEMRARAVALAALPEMLEALKLAERAVDALRRGLTRSEEASNAAHTLSAIRAAIGKATGARGRV